MSNSKRHLFKLFLAQRIRHLQADGLPLVSLALLVLFLHGSALSGSWRWDDGMHLLHTTQYPLTGVFFDFDIIKSVSGNQFAPWNVFLYYVNGVLFGPAVAWYYAHHLISLWAAAGGLYFLLRQWLSSCHAWIAPALLLVGVPSFQMAQQLMVGHYIYGLFFVSVGLATHVRAIKLWEVSRTKAVILYVAGATLYGLACLCKEIYVPWILMWLVVSWAIVPSVRRVAGCTAPAVVVAGVYAAARLHLFSGSENYYGGGSGNWEILHIAGSLFSLSKVILGSGLRYVLTLVVICFAIYAGMRLKRVWSAVFASALIVTIVPLLFLASSDPPWVIHARYLWAPWLLLCLVWAVPWRGDLQPAKWPACILFATLVIWQAALLRPEDQLREAMFDAHSKMVIQPPVGFTYWIPAEFNGPGYMTFVTYAAREALRRKGYVGEGPPPKIPRALSGDLSVQAITQAWDTECGCFRPLLSLPVNKRTTVLSELRAEKGKLLPGAHPFADAYQGPAPEIVVEGSRLRVTGTAASEGDGHHLILAGWAPSRLLGSSVTLQPSDKSAPIATMRYEILLEAADPESANKIRHQLCVLMQSQTHPYTYAALDAAAPKTACRKLLTPWALRHGDYQIN